MSDTLRKHRGSRADDALDLTQTIRKLSVAGGDAVGEHESRPAALLVCQDSDNQKWGPRWLERAGLEAKLVSDPAAALAASKSSEPAVIIVEAGARDGDGQPLFKALAAAPKVSAPIIVLCANTKEAQLALDAGVFDIVRKPYEWKLVANRARYAIRGNSVKNELERAKASLAEAVDIADRARQRLRSRESFEPVTGLPNKTKFIDLLRRGMRAVDRDGNVLAVFVIGFDRFRLVVEAMGQEHADLVLAEIGQKLNDCLRDAGSVQSHTSGLRTAAAASIDLARFALMLTCSGDHDELANLQQKLAEQLSHPVQIAGQAVYLSACIGIALYPQDARAVDRLLQRADNAMRDAQSRGGGFKFYCTETDAAAARKLKLEHMLHEALDAQELSVVYQPVNAASSGRISGAEALLRWQRADGGSIAPKEFVAIAEESGLMIRVGDFVLGQALKQLKAWDELGFALPHICVNVSKVQLMSGGFAQTVERKLIEYGIDPARLELELSERGVLSGDYDVISQLHELKKLGVRLSVDDFGTGDSAIAYLKELPIDVVKLDQSYVDGMTRNRKDAAIVSAMVALAQRLDLKVVAEGVETREQLEALRKLGCDELQGFYLSRPIPAAKFFNLLKKSAN